MADKRIAVLLGMHRSGTSLTASILEALGVDFGGNFIPADESNPKGYFEHAAITRAQVRLNRLLDRRPFTPAGLVDYPDDVWKNRQSLEFIDEVEMLVGKELARSRGIWGFKDPHTIKLLPLWQVVFQRLGVTPVYILAVRHPSEVAASVLRRDHIDPEQGELMWMDHNVAALQYTGYNIAAVTDYATWFSGPLPQCRCIIEALGLNLPDDDAALEALLDGRIDPALHRQRNTGDVQSHFATELYTQLLSVRDGSDPKQTTESLVERYLSARQLLAPAMTLLERQYRLHREKDLKLQLATQQLDKARNILDRFMDTRSGLMLRKYQILRARISNQSPASTPLARLQRILDKK